MTIQSIFEEFYQKKNQIEISIEKMKNDLGNMIDKIVLYGAGSAGIAFCIIYGMRESILFVLLTVIQKDGEEYVRHYPL